MKLTPVLWTYFKTKSGLYPVKIRIASTNTSEYLKLDVSVRKDQWDKKKNRVKDHPNAQEINLKIINTITRLEKQSITGVQISGDRDNFYWWFEEFLTHCKAKHGVYHQKKMTTVFNKLKEFRPKISAREIDLQFVKSYETWLIRKKYHKNYVADQLTRLRTIVKTMVKGGVIEYHKDPFIHFKIKKEKTKKDRLTIKEIEVLEKAKLDGAQEVARDLFLLSFYGGGIRFGDLCRINKSNFEGERLRYTMHKTSIEKNIKLNKKALSLWKKYKFRFPMDINWDREDLHINSTNSYMNKILKKVCEDLELPQITFHTARHSVADHAVRMKIPSTQMKGVLGHAKLATTEVYMKSFYQDETDEATDKLFGN